VLITLLAGVANSANYPGDPVCVRRVGNQPTSTSDQGYDGDYNGHITFNDDGYGGGSFSLSSQYTSHIWYYPSSNISWYILYWNGSGWSSAGGYSLGSGYRNHSPEQMVSIFDPHYSTLSELYAAEPDGCLPTCEDETDEAVSTCGSVEFVVWDDLETCDWHCEQCEDEYQEIVAECPYGFIFDNQTCQGRCKDCIDTFDDCEEQCIDHDGVQYHDCTFDSSSGFDTACSCNDGYDPNILIPSTDPPDPTTPEIPEVDPTNPDPDKTDPYSPAIKHNLDTIINQNNTTNNNLEIINENLAKAVDNQSLAAENMDGKLSWIGNLLKGIKSAIGSLKDSIGKNFDELIGVTEEIRDNQITDLGPPEQPIWDTELDHNEDLSEFDDGDTLAEGSAAESATELENLDIESPLNYNLDTSGSPCISGTVSVGTGSLDLSICFDRPWMLQAYNVMHIALIFIGYLQVALMLNRGMLA
jgi:hypothetical protein